MTEYMFEVSRVKLNRANAKRMDRIARRHGAYLVEVNLPGEGYKRWLAMANMGEPFNSATKIAVLRDLVDAGF